MGGFSGRSRDVIYSGLLQVTQTRRGNVFRQSAMISASLCRMVETFDLGTRTYAKWGRTPLTVRDQKEGGWYHGESLRSPLWSENDQSVAISKGVFSSV